MQKDSMTQLKFVVEQHADGFIAYPLGLQGAVVGEGDTSDAALADAKSAAKFHIETFGAAALGTYSPL
jgi:predicted RNase H-like HicB family nuclease